MTKYHVTIDLDQHLDVDAESNLEVDRLKGKLNVALFSHMRLDEVFLEMGGTKIGEQYVVMDNFSICVTECDDPQTPDSIGDDGTIARED